MNRSDCLPRFCPAGRAWLDHEPANKPSRDSERGDSTIEFVIWGSVLVLTMLLGLYAFRLSSARGEIQDAAQAGARAASLERDPSEAASAGSEAALAALPVGEPICRTASATVNISEWNDGWVAVTVTCDVDFAGLNPVAVASGETITYTWSEPIDRARREIKP